MNRLRVFALAGLALLGLSFGSAQAGYCRPACAPVVSCAPAPVVTPALVINGVAVPPPVVNAGLYINGVPAPCPVVTYRPAYYRTYHSGYHRSERRHCR
ncbi:MAG TPA: hypothetical protein VH120_13080 [Gemmataceae bacterium]|jgi:hypothetical protein|nr:hypothetical protein [Gemmataceae bacterium]